MDAYRYLITVNRTVAAGQPPAEELSIDHDDYAGAKRQFDFFRTMARRHALTPQEVNDRDQVSVYVSLSDFVTPTGARLSMESTIRCRPSILNIFAQIAALPD